MFSKLTLALPLMFAVTTPMQAHAQQHLPGAPPSFNGLIWDPPLAQGSATPEAAIREHSRGLRGRSE